MIPHILKFNQLCNIHTRTSTILQKQLECFGCWYINRSFSKKKAFLNLYPNWFLIKLEHLKINMNQIYKLTLL